MLQIEHIDPKRIVLNPNNTNDHPPGQIEDLAKSIKEFGFIVPIGLDDNNMLIYGEGRTMAAFQLGLDSVPFIRVSHLTEEQKKAFAIADKNVTSKSVWRSDRLSDVVSNLLEQDYDIDVLGFDDSQIEVLLKDVADLIPKEAPKVTVRSHERTKEKKPADKPTKVISMPGDEWQLGENILTVKVGSKAIDMLLEDWARITKMQPTMNGMTLKQIADARS